MKKKLIAFKGWNRKVPRSPILKLAREEIVLVLCGGESVGYPVIIQLKLGQVYQDIPCRPGEENHHLELNEGKTKPAGKKGAGAQKRKERTYGTKAPERANTAVLFWGYRF